MRTGFSVFTSRESPVFASRVAELGRKPVQDTDTAWLTRSVVRLTVTVAPGPPPGAGTVTGPRRARGSGRR